MGATEEQMALVAGSGIDHVAYTLILYSLASLLFLFVMSLIHVYDRAVNPNPKHEPITLGNGRVPGGAEDVRISDANEFELDGLVSDDEDEESAARRKLLRDDGTEIEAPLGSASTLGGNNQRAVS